VYKAKTPGKNCLKEKKKRRERELFTRGGTEKGTTKGEFQKEKALKKLPKKKGQERGTP